MEACTDDELGRLIEAYQRRDFSQFEEFHSVVRPELLRMARKRSYGLAVDVIDEVVQEVFLGLIDPSLVRLRDVNCTARQYLVGRVSNAVKKVRVRQGLRRTGIYPDPGCGREFVAFDEAAVAPVLSDLSVAIQARQLLAAIFAGFGGGVVLACCRVWCEHEPLAAVALDLGVSRFALARKLMAVRRHCAGLVALG
ncbi:MAG: hypothetical protein EPN33_00320 [Acidobacteria bacterium]|nr:MAG: hypothetical protein EPN33_00320 [Acidobacteriota bacterium]